MQSPTSPYQGLEGFPPEQQGFQQWYLEQQQLEQKRRWDKQQQMDYKNSQKQYKRLKNLPPPGPYPGITFEQFDPLNIKQQAEFQRFLNEVGDYHKNGTALYQSKMLDFLMKNQTYLQNFDLRLGELMPLQAPLQTQPQPPAQPKYPKAPDFVDLESFKYLYDQFLSIYQPTTVFTRYPTMDELIVQEKKKQERKEQLKIQEDNSKQFFYSSVVYKRTNQPDDNRLQGLKEEKDNNELFMHNWLMNLPPPGPHPGNSITFKEFEDLNHTQQGQFQNFLDNVRDYYKEGLPRYQSKMHDFLINNQTYLMKEEEMLLFKVVEKPEEKKKLKKLILYQSKVIKQPYFQPPALPNYPTAPDFINLSSFHDLYDQILNQYQPTTDLTSKENKKQEGVVPQKIQEQVIMVKEHQTVKEKTKQEKEKERKEQLKIQQENSKQFFHNLEVYKRNK